MGGKERENLVGEEKLGLNFFKKKVADDPKFTNGSRYGDVFNKR